MSGDVAVFEAGDLALQSGQTLPSARLVYRTYGTLNAARDNVIVAPTHYAGQHTDTEWLVGEDKALDPRRYFIVIPNMLGNGLSSSPSNTPPPFDGPRFPRVTLTDNISLQHRLLTEGLGVTRVQLVVGFSMGAQQAYHWAALHPELVARIAPICGSARTARHNFVFLEGLKAALTADAVFAEGAYTTPPVTGLKAFARVYAGWMFSQAFYREKIDQTQMGAPDLQTFLAFLEGHFLARDANDLLTMLDSWQTADIAAGGDLTVALGPSGRRRWSCPARRTSMSPWPTARPKSPACRMRSCGRSRPSGDTWRPPASTRWMRPSSTVSSRHYWRARVRTHLAQ